MENLKELKEICKDFKVMYVEDDESIASTLINYLSKFFKEVIYLTNGNDALDTYKDDKEFDIIISDIKMPGIDGLELTDEIKKINPNQNIIIVSAYSEMDNFLKSIKLGVDGFITKPIDYVNLNKTLFKTAEKIKAFKDNKIFEERLKVENNKLKQFSEVFDKVAIVSKTNTNKEIIYVNDFFCEISGYSKEELLGKEHEVVRHPDMPKSVFTKMWEELEVGNTWEGTIKNKAKDGSPYFLHYVVIPLKDVDGKIYEYIGIGFLTTHEELEKREFKKKVMTNYLEFKKTNINAIERISSLEKELESVKSKNESLVLSTSNAEKRLKKASSEVDFLEKKLKERDGHYKKILEMQKSNLVNITNAHQKALALNEKYENEIRKINEIIEVKTQEILNLNGKLNEQSNVVHDLRDTIKNINS
ncbi:response regulator [Arcobacter arenosus]|jgi:PAS domain S-box-containing protein|uniref:Response regulator n=1 Tax=Arcobacter arenosus TaxID=2576037 RepID=A0A5R8Y438_9BACT|nr:response regulator [Arcobacter arenosus]TLP40897.1 response regulator [Arcobacter arenosus]